MGLKANVLQQTQTYNKKHREFQCTPEQNSKDQCDTVREISDKIYIAIPLVGCYL